MDWWVLVTHPEVIIGLHFTKRRVVYGGWLGKSLIITACPREGYCTSPSHVELNGLVWTRLFLHKTVVMIRSFGWEREHIRQHPSIEIRYLYRSLPSSRHYNCKIVKGIVCTSAGHSKDVRRTLSFCQTDRPNSTIPPS